VLVVGVLWVLGGGGCRRGWFFGGGEGGLEGEGGKMAVWGEGCRFPGQQQKERLLEGLSLPVTLGAGGKPSKATG